MNIDIQTAPNNVSLLRTELGVQLNLGLKHFDIDYLESKQALKDTAQGRGTVHFFEQEDSNLVLRHYHRGGLYSKANKDLFLYTGIPNTRAYRELDVLVYLQSHNIKVASPVAARIVKSGLYYRADIITEQVSDAQELHTLLKLHEVDENTWMKVGKAIARLHQLDVRHDDINVKNVLITDQGEVVLIDFDKCKKQSHGNWKSANLARFYRSLIKQSNKQQAYFFAQSNWEALRSGYAEHIKD